MQIKHIVLAVATLFMLAGCYTEITGTVVDAETGQPIEGVVVLVEWTKTHGFGDTYTESYKVIEAVTDNDGKATISGTFSPTVNRPHVTVYKKGYVAWNNEYIFPDYKKRMDFSWSNGYVFRLERFKDSYSYIEHESFIDGAAYLFMETEKKKLFIKAYDEWEREKVIKERRNKGNLNGGGKK